jgi:hypothetical protein
MKKIISLVVLTVNFTVTMFGYTTTPIRSNAALLNDTIILFPDANFKNYLVSNFLINTNNDNNISLREAWNFKGKINISNISVTSILGIEYFQNVKVINCSNNPNIDSITYRFIGNNKLDSLILKNCGVHDYALPYNLKYLDITGNGATTQVVNIDFRIQNSNTVVLADSVVSNSFKIPGYSISHVSTDIYNSTNQQWYSPDFHPIQFVKPFTCTSIIGLTNIYTLYDKITWNTNDTTEMLFNICSGQYTATLSYQGSTMRTYTFNIVDTIINYSTLPIVTTPTGTIAATPTNTLTTTINSMSCAKIDSVMRNIGFTIHILNYTVTNSLITVLWNYGTNANDTLSSVIPWDSTGVTCIQAIINCQGTFRSSQTANIIFTGYVLIDNTTINKGKIIVDNSNNITGVVTDLNKENFISVAPNPFSNSTKVFINSTYTNVIIKLMNIEGIEVFKQSVTNNVIEINKENLSSGMYFLQVISNDKIIATEKVIIQ